MCTATYELASEQKAVRSMRFITEDKSFAIHVDIVLADLSDNNATGRCGTFEYGHMNRGVTRVSLLSINT